MHVRDNQPELNQFQSKVCGISSAPLKSPRGARRASFGKESLSLLSSQTKPVLGGHSSPNLKTLSVPVKRASEQSQHRPLKQTCEGLKGSPGVPPFLQHTASPSVSEPGNTPLPSMRLPGSSQESGWCEDGEQEQDPQSLLGPSCLALLPQPSMPPPARDDHQKTYTHLFF